MCDSASISSAHDTFETFRSYLDPRKQYHRKGERWQNSLDHSAYVGVAKQRCRKFSETIKKLGKKNGFFCGEKLSLALILISRRGSGPR